jgi:hypothetical protein
MSVARPKTVAKIEERIQSAVNTVVSNIAEHDDGVAGAKIRPIGHRSASQRPDHAIEDVHDRYGDLRFAFADGLRPGRKALIYECQVQKESNYFATSSPRLATRLGVAGAVKLNFVFWRRSFIQGQLWPIYPTLKTNEKRKQDEQDRSSNIYFVMSLQL